MIQNLCFNEFDSMILIERLFQINLGHPRLILAHAYFWECLGEGESLE